MNTCNYNIIVSIRGCLMNRWTVFYSPLYLTKLIKATHRGPALETFFTSLVGFDLITCCFNRFPISKLKQKRLYCKSLSTLFLSVWFFFFASR